MFGRKLTVWPVKYSWSTVVVYRKFKIVGGVGSFLYLSSLESPDRQAPQKFLLPYRMGSSRIWQGVTVVLPNILVQNCAKISMPVYGQKMSRKITVKVKEELGILLMLG